MRTAFIFIFSVLVVVAGFGIYFWMQPELKPAPRVTTRAPATMPAELTQPTTSPGSIIGAGEDVWVKTYDEKTGRLAFQLRAARYDPRPDGNSVDVTRPQAEIFLGDETDEQVLRIEGATGRMVMPTDAAQRGQINRQDSAPRRGELHDVVLSLFNASDMSRPVLVCRVNNVSFDNDTYRIATESFTDAKGHPVPADEVPVEIRGDEYDFDGRGLVIKWDGLDRRLALLEIAHGERLVVKSPEAIDAVSGEQRRTRANLEDRAMLASQVERRPLPATEPARVPSRSTVYDAVFHDAVLVTQDGRTIAQADELGVGFVARTSERDVVDRESIPTPTTRPRRTRVASTPSTKPVSGPIVVRWNGKLRVTPRTKTDLSPAPASGSFDLTLRGERQPVRVNVRGAQITCASIRHHSSNDSATIEGSEKFPTVEMRDSAGAMIQTPAIEFVGADRRATLRGASRAEFPVRAEPDAPQETATIQWSRDCDVGFAAAGNDFTVESARVRGEVRLAHPSLDLASDSLDVRFDPESQRDGRDPVLKQVSAEGSVRAALREPNQPARHVEGDQLSLSTEQTPDGRIFVRTFAAQGGVRVFDETQELSAGNLRMTLRPADSDRGAQQQASVADGELAALWGGAIQLETLVAMEDVRVRAGSGNSATAQQLRVSGEGADQEVILLGQPTATLSDGTNTIQGQHIALRPAVRGMLVHGPGTLHAVQRGEAGAQDRAVELTWSSGLEANGADNWVAAWGGVSATSASPDGARQQMSAKKLTILLADAPHASPPATAPVTDTVPLESMGGKSLKSMTLSGDTRLEMTTVADPQGGRVAREVTLIAPEAAYDAIERRFVVPGAGQMLVRDLGAPTTRPVEKDGREAGAFSVDVSGATAFAWQRDLIYDESQRRATMSGDVVIVHKPADENSAQSQAFRLEASEVAADVAPADGATAADVAGTGLTISRLTAAGQIRFSSGRIQFEAGELEFDLGTETLIARGTERHPAQIFDRQGVSEGSFDELWYNTRTDQSRVKRPQAKIRR